VVNSGVTDPGHKLLTEIGAYGGITPGPARHALGDTEGTYDTHLDDQGGENMWCRIAGKMNKLGANKKM
jgi:hypothetical protein